MTISNNNYSDKEKIFIGATGVSLIDGDPDLKEKNKSISIIIPVFNNYNLFKKCYLSLHCQGSFNLIKEITEIIIVDDASDNQDKLFKFINEFPNHLKTTVIALNQNQGRAVARNLGLANANNEIIIFLDADMIVGPGFIKGHLIRHNLIDNIAIIGLRENIKPFSRTISDRKIREGNIHADYKKDFRWKKFVPFNWIKIYKKFDKKRFNKSYYILKESNYLKKYNSKNKIGFWELSNNFLTANASISRLSAIKVGGFNHSFKGWGFEDIYFGYKIFLSGNYIIPCLNITAFHQEEFKSYDKDQFKKNYQLFKEMKKKKIRYWEEKSWKKQLKKKFQDFYSVLNFSNK